MADAFKFMVAVLAFGLLLVVMQFGAMGSFPQRALGAVGASLLVARHAPPLILSVFRHARG